ncbi:hypothetical protein P5673_008047 [Acropora cervicornis]|uniref:Uncharacterized protein n=1 Tax=Acropora cervicornis TaxID=6130 RepID=A0AAD9VBA6_ACRCE|nr:hypothetical protein P5673_008047 [Acropora cervicornis]
MKGDKFKVIGVVGLSSEEKLCSYYLNHNILDLVSSKQKEMQSKRKGGIVKTPIEQGSSKDSEDAKASTMGELRVLIRAIIDHLLSQLVMGIVKMNIQ